MRPTLTGPRLLRFATLALALAAVGARLGALHWLGDILALATDLYIVLALALLLIWAWRRSWRWAAVAGAVAALSGQQITDYTRATPSVQVVQAAEPRSLRLLMYNLYYLNEDLAEVPKLIEQYDPDVVFLMEYSFDVQRQIEGQFAQYPYRLIQPSRFTMGLALFSRFPLEAPQVVRGASTRIPVYQVQMRVAGRPFTLVGGHPWPPQPQWGGLHRSQMQAITDVAAQAPHPLIVAGDFNAAPWAYTVRSLERQARVRNTRQLFDLTKTWRGLPLIGLPVDHILLSEEWQTLGFQYGVPGGSDHLPIIVDLRLR